MSPSDPNGVTKFPMRVTVHGGPTLEKREISVQIFDHQGQRADSGFGDRQVELPIGLYTVRAEFSSQWQEQIVRHADGNTQVSLTLPERPSAVPVFGTSTAHEYYSYTSRDISKRMTGGTSGLFFFIRAENEESYSNETMWRDLSLLDEKRKRVLAFGPDYGEEDLKYGYFGMTVPLSPGMYILQKKGRQPREMPLYVFNNWQTQMFVFFRKQPLFESATILMSRWSEHADRNNPDYGFDPDDRVADAIDLALRGLQSDVEVLPNRILDILIGGKFENPMLGLLGAHFLLRRDKFDPGLLSMVLYNMNNLMPGSPDVAALAIMARANFGLDVDFGRPVNPPMLRPALEALYDLNARRDEYADLIPTGSLIESIAPHRYIDSAYTSWRPEERSKGEEAGESAGYVAQVDSWVVEYLKKQKEAAGWSGSAVDLRTCARRLNLPMHIVEAAWKIVSG